MGYGGFCTENAKFFYYFEKNFWGGNGGFSRNEEISHALRLPFPRKRESRGAASSATHRRRRHCTSASRNFPLTREEIPAFAGMEYGAGMERWGDGKVRGMGVLFFWGWVLFRAAYPRLPFPPPSFISAPLPFPRKRESRGAASSATHRRRRHCTSASRNFPLTREEIPAFAGMEYGAGMERWGMEVFFYPPPLAGGGCERDSGRGGWSVSDDVWDFATPQKFALRIFTPPRKRRRVRFRLSPEWKWVLGRGRQRLHCTAYYLPGKTTSSVFRNSGVTCAPAPLSL